MLATRLLGDESDDCRIDFVRVEIDDQKDLDQIASSINGITNDLSGFEGLLAMPVVVKVLQYNAVSAYAPGDPKLPADWPSDDADVASEYHAEFVYGGTQPLLVANMPIPAKAWVAKGMGA